MSTKASKPKPILKYGKLEGEKYFLSKKALGKDPFHNRALLARIEKELRSAGAREVRLPEDIDTAELWLFFKEFIWIFMLWGKEFGFRVYAHKRFIDIARIQCCGLVGSPDKGYCVKGKPIGFSVTTFKKGK